MEFAEETVYVPRPLVGEVGNVVLTFSKIDVCPESLGAMLEYRYIERGLVFRASVFGISDCRFQGEKKFENATCREVL